MSAANFPNLLRAAGVSRPWLARATGRTRSAVDRWCNGTASPPAEVVAWLERRLADPPPRLGRRGGQPGAGAAAAD
jgi:transcriptional regulator with XRE-family HTH domain